MRNRLEGCSRRKVVFAHLCELVPNNPVDDVVVAGCALPNKEVWFPPMEGKEAMLPNSPDVASLS